MKGHVVFSLDPRYGKTSLFFTHAGGDKAMASVFETFADFSAIGNVWKGLLLWGIQVTFPVPDRFPDLIFFPYSERFLRLADTKSRGKACGRPHQQLNPDMITRHITVCSKYFFFPGMFILKLLDFQCCSQAEGRITGRCIQTSLVQSDVPLHWLNCCTTLLVSPRLEMPGPWKHYYYGKMQIGFSISRSSSRPPSPLFLLGSPFPASAPHPHHHFQQHFSRLSKTGLRSATREILLW